MSEIGKIHQQKMEKLNIFSILMAANIFLESIIGLFCIISPLYLIRNIYYLKFFNYIIGYSRINSLAYMESVSVGYGYRFQLATDISLFLTAIMVFLFFIFCILSIKYKKYNFFYRKKIDSIVFLKMFLSVFFIYFVAYINLYFNVNYDEVPNYFVKVIMKSQWAPFVSCLYFSFFYFVLITTLNAILTAIIRGEDRGNGTE
ncbi:hypothetical protein QO005_001966 [Rhizobium paknamense]|uniref:Uncharacterized protein n=1 Tax=Rhizobium paknamense TaxID=1206817 RepID=A0ABU0IBM5_9HYPH|nr:hypothetical protein [Rhizobium paknamense]